MGRSVGFLGVLFVLLLTSFGLGATPAQLAETVRGELADAQLQLMLSPESARLPLERAEQAYAAMGVQGFPTPNRIQEALGRAAQSVQNGDEAAFAAAKAQVWTALLAAGFEKTTEAVRAGDAEAATRWLVVREFRQATRFSRPDADATLALRRWQQGELPQARALAAVRADLLDTYGARLNETLADVAAARAQGFSVRAAEASALAQGYFGILAPSFGAQRGAAALRQVQTALTGLTQGDAVAPVQAALTGFRAAPLNEAEQGRRAGQLLRFLSLVPIEYARAVRGGVVAVDLELHEAISFQEAAAAAFADLRGALAARNPAQTEHAADLLAGLTETLDAASRHVAVAEPDAVRASVDTLTGALRDLMPEAWRRTDSAADFDVIEEALSQLEAAVATGAYAQAENARIEAYAILESGPEAKLTAFAPQFVPPIENLFWYGQEPKGLAYLLSRHAPLADVQASRAALSAQLSQAQTAVSGDKAPGSVATNAAIIVFREGLEAVLILASLLGSLKMASMNRFRKPLWVGVWSALLASAVTFLLLRGALLAFAQFGEKLEAVVSLVAIVVLLIITNWFFHDTYWTDWMAGFHKKKARIIGAGVGQFVGLALLGFTSVYREGFETALFLQALVLEAGSLSVLTGVALGLAATFAVGFIIFKVQTKLPYKKMLVVTAVMLGAVLLIMVGNTVHVLQVVGWLPTHPLRFAEFPYWAGLWFGFYATWEGLALQAVAGVFVTGSYFLAEQLKERRRHVRPVKVSPERSLRAASERP